MDNDYIDYNDINETVGALYDTNDFDDIAYLLKQAGRIWIYKYFQGSLGIATLFFIPANIKILIFIFGQNIKILLFTAKVLQQFKIEKLIKLVKSLTILLTKNR